MVASYFSPATDVRDAVRPPACLDAMKKYQFTHPIAANPATMTNQDVLDSIGASAGDHTPWE
jgi:hypothetical protein